MISVAERDPPGGYVDNAVETDCGLSRLPQPDLQRDLKLASRRSEVNILGMPNGHSDGAASSGDGDTPFDSRYRLEMPRPQPAGVPSRMTALPGTRQPGLHRPAPSGHPPHSVPQVVRRGQLVRMGLVRALAGQVGPSIFATAPLPVTRSIDELSHAKCRPRGEHGHPHLPLPVRQAHGDLAGERKRLALTC